MYRNRNMAEVNYEAIELAYSLAVFTNRSDYTRTIAYEEDIDDEPFRRAIEYWGDRGECVFHCFLLIHEGVMLILQGEHGDENDNQKTTDSRFDKKDLPNGQKFVQEEIELKSIVRNSHNSAEQLNERKTIKHNSTELLNERRTIKHNSAQLLNERKTIKHNSTELLNERRTIKHCQRQSCSLSTSSKQTNSHRYIVSDTDNAPLCDSESDLTGNEDESEVLWSRPQKLDIQRTHELETDSDSFTSNKVNIQDQVDSSMELIDTKYPLVPVSKARWKSAVAIFKEVEALLNKEVHNVSGSQMKEVDVYRLTIVSTILNCIDNPTAAVNDCKRLLTQLNSLTLAQRTLIRALETPHGWKQRLTKRLHGKKWSKMVSLVHFINYMTWKWLALTGVQEGSGQTITIDTPYGPVHPIDDWCVRDKCQTCVEFVGKIPHECAIASNSKDQLVMIDSRNYVTVYTIEGKVLLAFKASTSRHPHARWIIGIDDDDNIYLGSPMGTSSDSKCPLSIFTSKGTLLSEPELHGLCRGRQYLNTVTKSSVILTLTIGTPTGNMVTLQHRDSEQTTSFTVREIVLPRVFNANNDSIVIGGTIESRDFAFQVFDHSGHQLYFYKPEVNFQYCQMDTWTGSLVLVTTSTRRDYRYCLCNTMVLTGEVCISATNGQTIQSGVTLRWPFRKVAGVTMMKCGLVAVVTIDEPYYAIHII